jgi:hypothetical protein
MIGAHHRTDPGAGQEGGRAGDGDPQRVRIAASPKRRGACKNMGAVIAAAQRADAARWVARLESGLERVMISIGKELG